MKKMLLIGATLAVLSAAGSSVDKPSHFPNNAKAKPSCQTARGYLGFDRNRFPGEKALADLRRTFWYSGYWLNSPPGETSNTWLGTRSLLHSQGFGFLVLFSGRSYKELKAGGDPNALGKLDAVAAVEAAKREGFPPETIIFLDLEEGGRLLPEQRGYVHAWVDGEGAGCSANYNPDGNCYAPGLSETQRMHIDVNTATSPDPSRGRGRSR